MKDWVVVLRVTESRPGCPGYDVCHGYSVAAVTSELGL